jgi:hypothetical protein
VELDVADRLRRALLEHGFTEAAALVEADIEAQELEEAEKFEEERVMRVNFSRPDDSLVLLCLLPGRIESPLDPADVVPDGVGDHEDHPERDTTPADGTADEFRHLAHPWNRLRTRSAAPTLLACSVSIMDAE